MIKEVTSKTFQEEVLEERNKIVQVYFWKNTCSACKEFLPILDKANSQLRAEIKTVKINAEENPDIAKLYEVEAFPLLYFFNEGKLIDKTVGAFVNPSYYIEHLNTILAKSKLSHVVF